MGCQNSSHNDDISPTIVNTNVSVNENDPKSIKLTYMANEAQERHCKFQWNRLPGGGYTAEMQARAGSTIYENKFPRDGSVPEHIMNALGQPTGKKDGRYVIFKFSRPNQGVSLQDFVTS